MTNQRGADKSGFSKFEHNYPTNLKPRETHPDTGSTVEGFTHQNTGNVETNFESGE